MNKNEHPKRAAGVCVAAILGGASLLFVAAPAVAFEIDTGSTDIRMRWDNTVKYNVGWRVGSPDRTLKETYLSQATAGGWDRGDLVTNRFDILSEFDFVYKEAHGVRVSAAGWHDFEFDRRVYVNPAYAAVGSPYPNNRFTDNVERYYGTGGEILDAFVFTRLDAGGVPINIRAGRHNVYWGESLFSFNSIAYGQGPLDLRKATSTPGIEAKELFLPQNQLSATALLTDNVSVAANYYLEWDPHRLPEGGTYLGAFDLSFQGGQVLPGGTRVLGDLSSGPNEKPDDRGSWGVNTQIRSATLGGTVGLYYREFDDRFPTMIPTAGGLANAYAEDVKLYGISFNRLIGAVSVGAELSHRQGTALASNGGGLALGDTWHGLVNMMAYIGKTSLFDSASLTAELTYTRLDDVDRGTEGFLIGKHEDYGCNLGKEGGCTTDDAWGIQIGFTPTWFQVMPGVDVTMPVNFGIGLKGNAVTPLGSAEGGGAWSAGVGLDIHSRYKVDLTYSDYFGDVVRDANGHWIAANGSGLLEDRGWVSLTFKTTF